MKTWDTRELGVDPLKPEILSSEEAARVIALVLPAGESLSDHEVHERHEVRATADARLLLVLAPWPGDGHPGTMTLDEKANARERARERESSGAQ